MKKYINIFVITALLFTGSNLFAQQKFDFSQFQVETSKFVLKPFNWETKDLLTAGGVILATVLVSQVDQPIKTEMMKDRSYENKGLMAFGTYYGDATYSVIFGVGLLAHGLIVGNSDTRQFGYEILQALTYVGAVALILKSAIGRERPGYTDNAFTFSPFALNKGDAYQSFPSGHACTAFAVSTVFASKFKNGWLKALCYVPAFITSFSRVYNNRHWTSDALLGSFLGYFVGKFVVDLHSDSVESDGNSLLSIRIKI